MKNPNSIIIFFWMSTLCIPHLTVAAEDSSNFELLQVPQISQAPEIDGMVDESIWDTALKINLTVEVSPSENTPALAQTEVLLMTDESQLYAAFRVYDPDPSQIRAHYRDRDELWHEDYVGICLDTFNDERRNFLLMVNPLGVQSDEIESETGDSSWDAIWESAGRITPLGYEVELSIHFNQLRFQRSEGTQIWGFDAVRNYPRSSTHLFGTFPRDRNNNCYRCQMLKIEGFRGATPGHNIEITPTATGVQSDSKPDFPDGNWTTANEDIDYGITGKWGLTPNLILNLTANPDFSQVEADAFRLDVDQPFALWYSERRTFFYGRGRFFQYTEGCRPYAYNPRSFLGGETYR